MTESTLSLPRTTSGLAITSLVAGIIGWVIALILLCLNFVILPLFTLATLGLGAVLYLCTAGVGCLAPVSWLVGAITGWIAKDHINQSGEGGASVANAGFIMSAVGLGFAILGVCIIAILAAIGTVQLPNPTS